MKKTIGLPATIFILFIGIASLSGQTAREEARRHFDRGLDAVEMTKTPDSSTIAIMESNQGANPEQDVNAKDKDGYTLLHKAVSQGQKEVAEQLIANGADIIARDSNGSTPLHFAFNEEVAELLVAKGANINAANNDGRTPLHFAAIDGQKKVVELLIANGADINARDKNGKTPLQLAENSNNKDVADLLRKHGASIESKDKVKSSIAKGAGMNARSEGDYSPPDMKARDENVLMSELFFAVRDQNMELVRQLIAAGADVNSVFLTDGRTPLVLAAENGYEDVAELLVAEGANINATDKKGFSPLQVAVLYNQKGVVELLIAKGANINAKDELGLTPLHFAVRKSHTDIVELLLAKGADVNAKSKDGSSPLHEINSIDDGEKIAELLIAKGADINAKDNSGYTPLDKARGKQLFNVADLLRKHDSLLVQMEGFLGMERGVTIFLFVLHMILLIIAFVDIVKSDFKGNYKPVWLFAVALVPLLGSLCYFFIGFKQKIVGKNQVPPPVG